MELDALVAEPAWEMFFDTAYFDMWCVRRVGETNFGAGFHVPSKAEAQALIDALEAERSTRVRLEEALRPFAKVGRLIDSAFGPALFADDDGAFQSGCAWTENGERKTLTWGDFRRASTSLSHSSSKGESRE